MNVNYCKELHNLTNKLTRLSFPINKELIPRNGIYILFEKGENAHNDLNRIVRIGTHTGEGQLFSRLNQHFFIENKDRSIFRKNIGRAILNQRKDPYLKVWDIDFTTRKTKLEKGHLINEIHQRKIEKKVTEYIQKNFSFCLIEVDQKEDRLRIESRLISTVSNCNECSPSLKWLGIHSPKKKIIQSGLWLVNELYKENFNKKEFNELQKLLCLENPFPNS